MKMPSLRRMAAWGAGSLAPAAWLQAVAIVAGEDLSPATLGVRWIFTLLVMAVATTVAAYSTKNGGLARRWGVWAVLLAGGGAGAVLVIQTNAGKAPPTLAAWGIILAVFALSLIADQGWTGGPFTSWGKRIRAGLLHLSFAGMAGIAAVLLGQMEARFSDEEFFAALQGLALSVYWLLLRGVGGWLAAARKADLHAGKASDPQATFGKWLSLGIAGAFGLLAFLAVRSYQASFYPASAPAFPGISNENPFLCGQGTPDSQVYGGQEVFQELVERIQANPNLRPPELGALALMSGESRWAESFRTALLAEARQNKFAQAANSVKSIQYDAALRAYYFARLRQRFPALFSAAEAQELQAWFGRINRRALTVEWVDWLYALAFARWPEGPYENQENGAGLLAVLETQGLADPASSSQNLAYLANHPRGWLERFRVSDDAVAYQPEWLHNAYFQSLYTGETPPENLRRSFEWLLLQALPDGSPLRYNHVGAATLDEIAYLGATLLGDGDYVWLAGRTLEYQTAAQKFANAAPGVESPLDVVGTSPDQGSCLLYGDSGLPTRPGPLAPDKIIFRDGWAADSAYLSLNLRFTGWHRYKASNTVMLVYQKGPLAAEDLNHGKFGWLPVGRSLFRDKRIPRENLNGLVIERSGLSAVLYALTGIGGPWAQDPPFYAQVERFETTAQADLSTTLIDGWRGWAQRRSVVFYHGGPIVILDDAQGPAGALGAFTWHLPGAAAPAGTRLTLRDGASPVEMVLVPVGEEVRFQADEAGQNVQVQGHGQIHLATVFLNGNWAGAEVTATQDGLKIIQGERTLTIPWSQKAP